MRICCQGVIVDGVNVYERGDFILASLFSENTDINLTKLKILDITGENKNLIPAIMCNRGVLVFTDAGHPDIFYHMWNAELGDCDIWYNEGSDPTGQIKHNKLSEMIDRGINASAAMLVLNPNAATNYQIGIENSRFSCGSVHYVCREVRAVIMSKLHLGDRTISATYRESMRWRPPLRRRKARNRRGIHARDRSTMKENAIKFG
jgi:precorrin-6Y C5,15-methyltransferase (decarboxylating)